MHGKALIRVEINRFFTGHNTDGRKADRRFAGCSGAGTIDEGGARERYVADEPEILTLLSQFSFAAPIEVLLSRFREFALHPRR